MIAAVANQAVVSGIAPGKIILSGEYAVVFGEPGIAVPSHRCMHVSFSEDLKQTGLRYEWSGIPCNNEWYEYFEEIIRLCQDEPHLFCGSLAVDNQLPLGKGMGSSTSLVIATARALLGDDCKARALAIEDAVNPNHSGLDFSVIWNNQPVYFEHGKSTDVIELPENLLDQSLLIDTGAPKQSTAELVAWIQSRAAKQEASVLQAIKTIGQCSTQLRNLKSNQLSELVPIIMEHHQAQVALGVVPKKTQALIADIEAASGFAKVVGAGSRTGGGGMVLAWHANLSEVAGIAERHGCVVTN